MASKNWVLFMPNKHGVYEARGLVSDNRGGIYVSAEELAEVIPLAEVMVEIPSFASENIVAALDKWKRERNQ